MFDRKDKISRDLTHAQISYQVQNVSRLNDEALSLLKGKNFPFYCHTTTLESVKELHEKSLSVFISTENLESILSMLEAMSKELKELHRKI